MTLVKSISVIQSLSVSWCSESFMKVQIIIWRSCHAKSRKFSIIVGFKSWSEDQIWKIEELHNDFYVEWNPTILRRILRGGYLLLLYFQRWVKRNSVLTSILTYWRHSKKHTRNFIRIPSSVFLTNDSPSPIFSHFPSILRYLPNCKHLTFHFNWIIIIGAQHHPCIVAGVSILFRNLVCFHIVCIVLGSQLPFFSKIQ